MKHMTTRMMLFISVVNPLDGCCNSPFAQIEVTVTVGMKMALMRKLADGGNFQFFDDRRKKGFEPILIYPPNT